MSSGAILLEAHALINAERQDDYGPPSASFARAAALWSAYLGHSVTDKDVAVCMALLKVSREASRHKRDNLLDAAGYIGLAADMEEQQKSRGSKGNIPAPQGIDGRTAPKSRPAHDVSHSLKMEAGQ